MIGVTDSKEVTIGDLDFSIDNTIRLVPYGDGISYPGKSDEIRIEASSKGAKDEEPSGEGEDDEQYAKELEDDNSENTLDNPADKELYSDDSERYKRTYPKNPDCGIVKYSI